MLKGRSIQIAGSADENPDRQLLAKSHAVITALTRGILRAGGTVIVGIGDDVRIEPGKADSARLFDWTVLDEVAAFAQAAAATGSGRSGPYAKVITSPKNIDKAYAARPGTLTSLLSSGVIDLRPLEVNWSAAAYIRQRQAEEGHGLVIIGGGEGVEHSASLYVERGRVVVPLDANIGAYFKDGNGGAAKLYQHALSRPERFVLDGHDEYRRRLQLASMTRQPEAEAAAREAVGLLETFATPYAFCVRLLNPSIKPDYVHVDRYFSGTVVPCLSQLGFQHHIMGHQEAKEAYINQEIFERLHYAEILVADLTSDRLNNYLEAGYGLGHRTPVIFTAKEGTRLPFDTTTMPVCFWSELKTDAELQREFIDFWNKNARRPHIVRRRELG
ncbi:hypothetical protein HUW63_28035 [Myxococcus sp. AM001]|nr:hypothetical protein [Myxococcus sp. AM001]